MRFFTKPWTDFFIQATRWELINYLLPKSKNSEKKSIQKLVLQQTNTSTHLNTIKDKSRKAKKIADMVSILKATDLKIESVFNPN